MLFRSWFFSSCGGILELRRGFQASSCVSPGKPKLPFEFRGNTAKLYPDVLLPQVGGEWVGRAWSPARSRPSPPPPPTPRASRVLPATPQILPAPVRIVGDAVVVPSGGGGSQPALLTSKTGSVIPSPSAALQEHACTKASS